MITLISVIHVLACLLLIALVLLQDPKATGAGSMFGGGGSNTVLGATGATTLLQKLTRYAAIVFGVCCLLLAMNARRDAGSVFDSAPESASATETQNAPGAPTAPAQTGGEALPATGAPAASPADAK